ncbi:hypothetical protein IKB17_02265 [bacterium]|nr:hypothetical protein [bacterium]
MAGIDPLKNGAAEFVAKALGMLSKTKPVKKMTRAFQENPETALVLTTVGSIVIKDGIGCKRYVSQSLNNEKIPEERRSFVAAVDLVNGIIMIVTQIAMFFLMRKISEPMFNKMFKKSFNSQAKRDILSKISEEYIKMGQTVPTKIDANKAYEKARSDALKIFKTIADVGIATIIGKRIITPFVSTPIANVVQEKYFKKDKKKVENTDKKTLSQKNVIA